VPVVIRGLDSPEKLREFFRAKGYRNLVLRAVDMLEMRVADLDYLLSVVFPSAGRTPGETHKQFLLRLANPDGYCIVPWDRLLARADLDFLERLQAALAEYRTVRYHKGEPMRSDPCRTCAGRQRVGCHECDGTGVTHTWLELSAEETAFAEQELE